MHVHATEAHDAVSRLQNTATAELRQAIDSARSGRGLSDIHPFIHAGLNQELMTVMNSFMLFKRLLLPHQPALGVAPCTRRQHSRRIGT